MARIRVLGTAFVLACLLLAVSAAGASAAPEWAACAKATPKNTGNYSDKLCSVASEPGKGKYALLGGSVGKGKLANFKGLGPQTLHFVVPGTGDVPITCARVKGTGAPLAPSGLAGVVLEFSKCTTLKGAVPCENVKKETIETEPLSGVLAEIEGKVGTILKAESGEILVTFGCGGVFPKLRALDQVFGEYTGATNVVSKTEVAHYVVGTYLGSVEYEAGRFYEPLTNPPSAGPPGHGVLGLQSFECAGGPGGCEGGPPEWRPPGGLPGGLEGELEVRGEALMIKT